MIMNTRNKEISNYFDLKFILNYNKLHIITVFQSLYSFSINKHQYITTTPA